MSKLTRKLHSVPIFSKLTEETLEEISRFFTIVQKEKKIVINYVDEVPDSINFLTFGTVMAITEDINGEDETVNHIYQPGSFFAESSLDSKPLPFTLKTRETCTFLRIKTEDFKLILKNNFEIHWDFSLQLAAKNLEYYELLTLKKVYSVRERLMIFLKSFYNKNPLKTPISLTHREIAGILGSARETISRFLEEFEKNGQIQIDGRKIIPKFE